MPNGNAVRSLAQAQPQTAGPQTLEWDGRTDGGKVVALDGGYTIRLTVQDPTTEEDVTHLGTVVIYK